MGKLKVYELAKEMNLTNQEMIEKLKNIGVEVKSHLSTVEDSVVEKLKGGASKKADKAPKEEKKQEQMHIIRRNVRVINTSETVKSLIKLIQDLQNHKQVNKQDQ